MPRASMVVLVSAWLTVAPAVMAEPADVVTVARTAIGVPYVWGGQSLRGMDCSGLVVWAYAQVGITVPRTSQQQANAGQPVDRADLQPGDVIAFYPNASHVGIYTGAGQVIHASTTGRPVAEVPIDAAGPYRNARRYLRKAPTMPATIDYGITRVMHGYNPTTPANATGNSNGPRRSTLYAVVHTQEGDGTAVSLANYLNNNKVSYNIVVDAIDTVEVVPVDQGPWAAMEANDIAFHLCFAGSRAGWKRADWLSRDAMLKRGAKAVAAACKQFGIPPVKVLSTNGWPVTPKGIAGHVDFGKRGGGHTDPGEFVWPEFIDMVNGYMDTPAPPSTGGTVDALKELTPAEQHELLDNTRWIKQQLGQNIWGPDSSMGLNVKGEELTVRDGLAAHIRKASAS